MVRGIVRVNVPEQAEVPAPRSGVRLGNGQHGPVAMRLFRPGGTRVLVVGSVVPARLIAVRAAAIGSAVRVISSRDWIWTDIVRHSPDVQVVAPGASPARVPGSSLVVDDRPSDLHATTELAAWECQLRLRAPSSAGDLMSLANCDLAILSTMNAQLALSATTVFAIPASNATQLATLPAGVVAAVRRGRVEYVQLDPSPDEQRLLGIR